MVQLQASNILDIITNIRKFGYYSPPITQASPQSLVSSKERLSGEDTAERLQKILALTFAGFCNRHHGTENRSPKTGAEAAGHFLPVFAFAQIPLAQVVVKADSKIVQEQKMIVLILFQALDQGFFFFERPLRA